jgi:alanine dehydrogenase
VIVRVERPRDEDWQLMPAGTTVIGFLHLAVCTPPLVRSLRLRNLTLVGLETVEEDDGTCPLQEVASQIAGRMAPQLASHLLEANQGGMGILLAGLPGIPPADVVILGAGMLGTEATRGFRAAGATVYVLDNNIRRLAHIDRLFGGTVVTAVATHHNIAKFVPFAEVLIGAVRNPQGNAPLLVPHALVQQMKRGAVILDFAINAGGCVETSRLAATTEGSFVHDGVVHYALPNVPSLVPRTATYAFTQGLQPYLHLIATQGVRGALRRSAALRRGTYLIDGQLTQQYVGREAGLVGKPVDALLQ